MDKEAIFQEISQLFEDFKAEHYGKTKISQQRARKVLGEIKNKVSVYRKASLDESK